MVRIYFEFLKILQSVMLATPPRTPKRAKFITTEFKRLSSFFSSTDCLFSVTADIGSEHKNEVFDIDNNNHLEVYLRLFSDECNSHISGNSDLITNATS